MTDARAAPNFDSAAHVAGALRGTGYVPDTRIASIVHLADRLGKPILIQGPAGTGKTQLARSVADATRMQLIRLQCYEGLDESKALYEWDYRRQLLQITAQQNSGVSDDLFGEQFLLTRPLLSAIRSDQQAVLLIDEVDRLDVETEALLLEVLSEFQVSIPELGTLRARVRPLVFLTSNNSRDLSEALKRRCLFLHIGYPSVEREREIVLAQVPGISSVLAGKVSQLVRSLRGLDLKKRPSVSETLDWARTLLLLGVDDVSPEIVVDTLPVLLKNEVDIEIATKELDGSGP
jgi:MoxR-like ATPase